MDFAKNQPRSAPAVTGDYVSRHRWSAARPSALVIACSDGRLQKNLDDFLQNHLGISDYDRLYLPGGPGALAGGGSEYLRASQLVSESTFLVKSHGTEEVVLIFHGATPDGPEEAICADYRRKHGADAADVSRRQEEDLRQLLQTAFRWAGGPRVRAYLANVDASNSVRFSAMSVSV